MNKIWRINKKAPESFLNKFPEYSKLTLQLLWDRRLKTQKAIDEFFNPDYDKDLHNPFLLKDIRRAIKRIEKASKNKEKVAIFADYDADGVCGATILTEILKIFKIKPEIYIPDRNREGYGLNLKSIKDAAEKKVGLIITIDCGVTDFEEIKLANKLGMDVIIVDHHEIPKKLPPALAIINPKQKTCKYAFKHLSATGVAFKLSQAVAKIKKLSTVWEKWLLDLIAISTAADSMPLLGENRTLMKYGLVVLSQTKRLGLEALMETARIKPVYNSQTFETNLTTYTLCFVLAPRINAASRVAHGNLAFRLLNTSDKEKAKELANTLEKKNQQRQQLVKKVLGEARKRVLKYARSKKVILEGDKDWPGGIAGLVAQKLKEEFYLPTFIYQKLDNFCAGSVRSMAEVDVVKVMRKCQDILLEHGGHPVAAGFKILKENIDRFRILLEKQVNKIFKNKKIVPILNIDSEMEVRDLNWIIFKEIQRFAPFDSGNELDWGNKTPLFLMKKINVLNIREVGSNGGHLKMSLQKDEKKFKAIGFNLADFCDKIKVRDKIDIVFELISNEWNGMKELQLKIIDLKKS
jgi:single-stranded-DNA-specific exonuclease